MCPRPLAAVPRKRRSRKPATALQVRGVWHELRDGPAILRGVELTLHPGETVALMGRNGAGKSTLLRHAAGLLEPTRGRIERAGRVALLLQNPGDYFVHERVCEETSAEALQSVGLAHMAAAQPARPLRRRAPTPRAGDRRGRRSRFAGRPTGGARAGRADAGHGPRGQGRAGAGAAPPRRAGTGGDRGHARPRVRRILRAARGAARRRPRDRRRADRQSCSPAAGTSPPRPPASSAAPAARCCPSRAPRCCAGQTIASRAVRVSWPLGLVPARRARSWPPAGSLRAPASLRAHGRRGGDTRRPRRARPRRVRGAARRQADHRDRVRRRLRPRPAARVHRRRDRHARVEHHARPGPVHPLADGRLGSRRARRRGARAAQRPAPADECRWRSPAPPRR